METLGYVASIFMGLSLGMMGGGGSILTVPILVYLFAIHPLQATSYSLFIVGLTALIGGLSYLRRHEVDLKTGIIFAVPSFLAVMTTRSFVIPHLPDPLFSIGHFVVSKAIFVMMSFALLMVLASRAMIRPSKPVPSTDTSSPLARIGLIGSKGLLVGTVTGFVGAGGGFLIIPALVLLVGLPMKKAVGTSLFIIAANSLLGFVSDARHQTLIDWRLLLTISAISMIGLAAGTMLALRISERALKKGFGFFVLAMGLLVLGDQIYKLQGG